MMHKRIIELPNGETLELDYNESFYDKIREHFGLSKWETPSDLQIRNFIWGACKTALDRKEQEMKKDGKWEDS